MGWRGKHYQIISNQYDSIILNLIKNQNFSRVVLFNCFIWDFCSVLWRSAPLPSLRSDEMSRGELELVRENSILFTDISEKSLQELHEINSEFKVSSSLSLTHGATFSGFASSFLSTVQGSKEKNNKNIETFLSPDLLTGKLKVKYLDYLKEAGFTNIFSFLTSFIGSLSNREKNKKKKKKM